MDEFERLSYFRVDQGKSNTRPPAKKADWYKFESVTLPNGDDVGVVTAWERPREAAPGAGKKADDLFLRLLDRFSLEGRYVSETASSRYAPHVFSKEPEAKAAKIGKEALAEAMRRLFAAGAIKLKEFEMRSNRAAKIIVRASPATALFEGEVLPTSATRLPTCTTHPPYTPLGGWQGETPQRGPTARRAAVWSAAATLRPASGPRLAPVAPTVPQREL